ncbi:MAG: hypothetical protein Q8O35_11565 [Humidesulfovibrio sp.]|uniref:hypothetical protein n=1 Tax=Humidesulfovibrio sp. TaxID=2910988 RepID=UPI002732E2EB|nr:hypothetical protein [Humidesulfovibrio sp.]MDP2848811.1 hypothetical protein [Humidesulfovibrio sp.]
MNHHSSPDTILLVPFRAGHAASLRLRPEADAVLSKLAPLAQLAAAYEAAGPAWTLMAGGWPLVCGGAVRFWPGVGELWCWAGQEAGHWSVAIARQARATLLRLRDEHGFHRLQAHVRETDQRARGFAQFLGLAQEGRCPGYGPDQATHILYGRFFGWKA